MDKTEYVEMNNTGRIFAKTKKGKQIIKKYNLKNKTITIKQMLEDKENFEFISKDNLI